MKETVINEVIARRFLLGELSAEEQARIEEQAFEDPNTFAAIEASQEDLIDDFLNDELSPEEKDHFQNYFLAQPGRRQDLRMGRVLQQYLDRDEVPEPASNVVIVQPKSSIFGWLRLRPALASLIAVILLALIIIVVTRRGDDQPILTHQQPTPALPTPSSSPVATPDQPTPSPTPGNSPNPPAPTPRQPVEPVYAFVLVPGGPTRSEGDEPKVRPVSNPISFELPLIDDAPYQHYRALLQKDGRTLQTWSNLKPREMQSGRALNVIVPANTLDHPQHYRIVVMGVPANAKAQPVHTYYFHVSN